MRTLSEIIRQTLKYKKESGLKMYSTAYGPVTLVGVMGDNKIQVQDQDGASFMFDPYGRIHPRGTCLLFPETKESWDVYLKNLMDSYYDSLIRVGDVCLVKRKETDNWTLAIYDGKMDGKYRAKIGVETETFMYCISYSDNSSYLGRGMFPDWMIPEDEDN